MLLMKWRVQRWFELLPLTIVRMLPRKLRYWAVIDAAAFATTGKYGDTEAPAMALDTFLRRIGHWAP